MSERSISVARAGRDADGKVIPHVRSEVMARLVADLVRDGADENYIAVKLNIRPGHLKQHYGNELTHGLTEANTNVAKGVYNLARPQGDMEVPLSLQAAKFWLKSRAGWRDGEQSAPVNASPLSIHIHT